MTLAPSSWPTPLWNAIRASNRHLLNPVMLRLAGHRHWYAAAIRHTGRRTGKEYATPVVAERVPDGFLVPLPYGTRVDWLQNVLAAGRATITVQGQTYEVAQPEVIDAAAALPLMSERRRRTFQRVGIVQYLKTKDRPAN